MALGRPANPQNHVGNRLLQAGFPDVRPAVHEEIRVGLQFRELDARVGLEGVPKVAAAIAHQLHFALVLGVAGDEFAPIVLQAELLDQKVVRMCAVVRQFRPFRDPLPQRGEDHVARRRPQFFRVEFAKAIAVGIEGDLQIGVFGDSALVGSAGGDALGPRRGEAHLVDPNVAGKLRFHRPSLACVEAAIPPELYGFDVDSQNPGSDPIGAVEHDERYRLLDGRHRQLRGGEGRVGGVAGLGPANGADVCLNAVFPFAVLPKPGGAFRAPWVPFRGFRGSAFVESGGFPLPAPAFSRRGFGEREQLSVREPG